MCVAHFRVGERKELRRKNSLISQVFFFLDGCGDKSGSSFGSTQTIKCFFLFFRLLLMLTWLRLAGLWAGLNNARDKID